MRILRSREVKQFARYDVATLVLIYMLLLSPTEGKKSSFTLRYLYILKLNFPLCKMGMSIMTILGCCKDEMR